jgi:integrase
MEPGSLVDERGAWYGRWRDGAGNQYKRKLGKKRTAGERDGLTKSQAEAKLRDLIQAEQAFRAAVDRVTVAEAAAAHLQRLEVRAVKRSYLQTVESIVRVHLADAPEFRTKELARIDEDDIERYVLMKIRQGKSPKTMRNHLGVLHSVFELGQRRKWCARNPVK